MADRRTRIEPATLEELAALVEAMPERLRAMVLLAAWAQLRFGELVELRRKDVVIRGDGVQRYGVVKVRRGAVRVDGKVIVGPAQDLGRSARRAPPAPPVARNRGAPGRPHRARRERTAVPGRERWDPRPGDALQALLQGAGGSRAAGPRVPPPCATRARCSPRRRAARWPNSWPGSGTPRRARPCATSTLRAAGMRKSRRG